MTEDFSNGAICSTSSTTDHTYFCIPMYCMYNIASYVMGVEPGHIDSSILFRFESGHCGMKCHDSVNISYEFASDKCI